MSECADLTYYQRNWDVILNRAKDYENDKERLREQTRDKYRNLSEEEKNEKREYGKKQISQYVWKKKKKKIKRISKKKKILNIIMNSVLIVIVILIVIQIK